MPESIAGLVPYSVTSTPRLNHSELPRDQAQAQGSIVLGLPHSEAWCWCRRPTCCRFVPDIMPALSQHKLHQWGL